MKKFSLGTIFGFVLATVICVGAVMISNANEIAYKPIDEKWNVDNVQSAIDDLYNKYYSASDVNELISGLVSYDYGFESKSQTFTAPINGTYKIELWGASGANGCGGLTNNSNYYCNVAGLGGYVSGNIHINKGEQLYVYVGGMSENNLDTSTTYTAGGWNGGGRGMIAPDKDERGTGGGGATDIRLVSGNFDDFNSLKSRIMVAGGGGGAHLQSAAFRGTSSGNGGGLTGVGNVYTYGNTLIGTAPNATQTTGFKFGIGQDGYSTGDYEGSAGAGGGYYGGKNIAAVNSTISYYGGGAGGGSGFISGYTGCNAIAENSTASSIIHTGQPNHYSGKVFTDGIMIGGNEAMPKYDGTSGTMVGNYGNGHARISLISLD